MQGVQRPMAQHSDVIERRRRRCVGRLMHRCRQAVLQALTASCCGGLRVPTLLAAAMGKRVEWGLVGARSAAQREPEGK